MTCKARSQRLKKTLRRRLVGLAVITLKISLLKKKKKKPKTVSKVKYRKNGYSRQLYLLRNLSGGEFNKSNKNLRHVYILARNCKKF